MKIGRNEPCPCGSGKKHKHCCGSLPAQDTAATTILAAVRYFQRIAYLGAIGRARKAFCIAFTKQKQLELEKIQALQHEQSRLAGEEVQCRKGCVFCCAHFVGGTLQECEGIVHFLYTHPEALNGFLRSYPVWRKAVAANEALFKKMCISFREMSASGFQPEVAAQFALLCHRYLALDLACPFLQEKSCLIYPVRPRGCAALYATTPPSWCAPQSTRQPKQMTVTAQHHEMDLYYGKQTSLVLSNVPLMVYELLKGGYIYLAGIPGLKGIDWAALNDPEVRRIPR